MKIVSVSQMRELDYRTINEGGISGKELMKRAGTGVGEKILEYANSLEQNHVKRFVLLAGKGNNGGDAYVLANYLRQKTDKEIVIYSICHIDELKGAAKFYAEELEHDIKISVKKILKEKHFFYGDIIVDALLGTGFQGELQEPYLEWIKLVNSLRLPVVAVDIPSGLNGDTGEVGREALKCDVTVTIGMPKIGLVKGQGPVYCGCIKYVDIGIPQEYMEETKAEYSMFNSYDAYMLLDRLYMNAHKKSFGSVLVIGGSKLYPGAPFLAGKSALRAGAGVVTVAVPESSQAFSTGIFSLITRRINDDGKGFFTKNSVADVKELIEDSDVIVVGPGMSNNNGCREFLREVMKTDKPMVVDADALNLIAIDPTILPDNKTNMVFTPHPGEGKRLLDCFGVNSSEIVCRIDKALKLSEFLHGTVVYKGNKTVIVSNEEMPCVNGSGGPALATAGSGDVLAGVIGAYIGTGLSLHDSACLSVYLHGLTAEINDRGARGFIADDIIELIPYAVKRSSPFA